ncbi:MAG: photosynthetic complex putative assembly protein PuhB [Pseudomonadota bacterium]
MASTATAALPDLIEGGAKRQAARSVTDYEAEIDLPRGLPAQLPPGEHVVWQGAPRRTDLAHQLFHVRFIAAYFAAFSIYRAVTAYQNAGSFADAAIATVPALASAAIVIALFELLAWLSARSTIYTITNRRVVMRIGIALSKTIDIPFKRIESLHLRVGPNGVGNIAIELTKDACIPYLILWPYARPWHLRHPQPMLRAMPDASSVAKSLVAQLKNVSTAEQTFGDANKTQADDSGLGQGAECTAPVDRVDESRARIPLLASAGLVVLTLIAVTWGQFANPASERTAARSPYSITNLRFENIGHERFAVTDTRGRAVTSVEPGRDGLVRNALRSLERERQLRGLTTSAPYQLVTWDTGQLTLSDLGTDRHIPLDSFGPAHTGALADLLSLRN